MSTNPSEAQLSALVAQFTPDADAYRIASDFVRKHIADSAALESRTIDLMQMIDSRSCTLVAFTKGLLVSQFRCAIEADANLFFGKDFMELSRSARMTIVEARLKILSELYLEFAEKGPDFKAEHGS